MKFLWAGSVLLLVALFSKSSLDLQKVRSDYESLRQRAEVVARLNGAPSGERKARSQQKQDTEFLMRELQLIAEKTRDSTDPSVSEKRATLDQMLMIVAEMEQMGLRQFELIEEQMREESQVDRETGNVLAQTYLLLLFEMAKKRPAISLDLMRRVADIADFGPVTDMMMGKALSDWAEKDPVKAVGWYQDIEEDLKPYQRSGFMTELIVGAATADPAEAHQILKSLGEAGNPELYLELVKGARGSADKGALLSILREEHPSGGRAEDAENYLGVLAVGDYRSHRGFEVESMWIDQAGLTDDEMLDVLQAVEKYGPSEEKGRWLEWLQKKDLPGEMIQQESSSLLGKWVLQDFQRAGEWLLKQPEGDFWNQSAGVYADTIFQQYPEEAVLWLESLPLGDDRRRLSRSFYENWPQDSPDARAAAEAFAKREGVN